MGRWSNGPDEVESLKRITIADLKKLGYLQPNVWLNQNIHWTNQYGERVSSITVIIETTETGGYITFDYTYNQSQKINYKVKLITRPSNLGDGLLWFFVCPNTQKVCRKLHLNGGYLDDKFYEELYKKHFKKFYNGKPTKKYLKLVKKINARRDISFEDLERALLM
jgi:hypothetical protein